MKGKNQGSISGAKQTVNVNKQTSGSAKGGGKANFNQGALSKKGGKTGPNMGKK